MKGTTELHSPVLDYRQNPYGLVYTLTRSRMPMRP
jgi:hypothetical protein